MSTHYTVQTIDPEGHATPVGDPVSKLDRAKELAAEHHLEIEGSLTVQVITENGSVSFEIPANDPAKTARARTKPFTKTEPRPDWMSENGMPEGYTLAYIRSRVKTGVFRANDKSDWLIKDFRDGTEEHFPNTETARVLTNAKVAAYNAETKAKRERVAEERRVAREEAKAAKLAAAAEKVPVAT